ncbi:MAG: double-strand break repair protein AddB [Hyphomicrobiaceae bacterium]
MPHEPIETWSDAAQPATRHGTRAPVYTIEATSPFLTTLAAALLSGSLSGAPNLTKAPTGIAFDLEADPAALSDVTVLLPTSRSVRAFSEALLTVSRRPALALPNIRAIADPDEDALAFAGASVASALAAGAEIPDAISPLRRDLLLGRMILERSHLITAAGFMDAGSLPPETGGESVLPVGPAATHATSLTAAHALRLARELGALLDAVETEEIALDGVGNLVPDEFSAHWRKTAELLDLVLRDWPAELAARDLITPAARRNAMIRAEARRIASGCVQGPIIVAGVTGSVPATVELMRAVINHPRGALVLPHLDAQAAHGLDDRSFSAILPHDGQGGHPEHPQFTLASLLAKLGIARSDVRSIGATPSAAESARMRFIAEVMRPAETTPLWRDYAATTDHATLVAGLTGISRIETDTAHDEAEVIAIALRQTLEDPDRTAALVTPDRGLARRVVSRMRGWGVEIDDSAGRPLRKMPVGSLIDLALACISERFAPKPLVALLKHPLCRLGLPLGEIRRRARNLELAAFRTIYLGDGLADVRRAVEAARDRAGDPAERAHRAVRALSDDDWRSMCDLIERIEAAFAGLTQRCDADTRSKSPLQDLSAELCTAIEVLARPHEAEPEGAATAASLRPAQADTVLLDATMPWSEGEDGPTAARLLTDLCAPDLEAPKLTLADFVDIMRLLISIETVRAGTRVHDRLAIWGPFEARLQRPDVVILGGLNERVWPEAAKSDPWLNRPMRRALGLTSPEVEIGRAAHDFCGLIGAKRVILTRARKRDGAPTVPSRWLLRTDAVLGALDLPHLLDDDGKLPALAKLRNQVDVTTPAPQPRPKPPLQVRPKRLSVTDIETWITNPYALYARRILKLEPLPQLGQVPDAALRGSVIHAALRDVSVAFPDRVPNDLDVVLFDAVRTRLRDYASHPSVAAFWITRFARFATWFAETEADRRQGVTRTHAECDGSMQIAGNIGRLLLTARADRIDETESGLSIYDYKGTRDLAGLARRAEALRAPQLPLEAAIAAVGGFAGLKGRADRLAFISTDGGDTGGDCRQLSFESLDAAIDRTVRDLTALVDRYADPETPYTALRRPGYSYDYDDYDQLARVREWLSGDGEDVA